MLIHSEVVPYGQHQGVIGFDVGLGWRSGCFIPCFHQGNLLVFLQSLVHKLRQPSTWRQTSEIVNEIIYIMHKAGHVSDPNSIFNAGWFHVISLGSGHFAAMEPRLLVWIHLSHKFDVLPQLVRQGTPSCEGIFKGGGWNALAGWPEVYIKEVN